MTLIPTQAAHNPLEPVSNSHVAWTMTPKKARHKWRTFRSTRLTFAAFGLLLVAAPGYAQTIRKETAMTRLSNRQLEAAPQTATAEIRPFHINVPEQQLADLRRRIAATQWPERETVSDATQGVQAAPTVFTVVICLASCVG